MCRKKRPGRRWGRLEFGAQVLEIRNKKLEMMGTDYGFLSDFVRLRMVRITDGTD